MRPSRLFSPYLLILMFLVGCQLKSEYKADTSTPVVASCPSRSESSRTLSDLQGSTQSTTRETVAALAFTSDGQSVWIAYSREPAQRGGQLLQLRIPDWQVPRTLELDSLNERFTRFNGDATLLVSFHQYQCNPSPPPPPYQPSLCYELKVWTLRTAIGKPISEQSYTDKDLVNVDFAKSGTWLLTVRTSLAILNPTKPSGWVGGAILAGEEPESVVTATFNHSENLIAYGTDKKRVRVAGWNGHSLDHDTYIEGFGPISHEVRPYVDLDHKPIKLAIAPNNKWLAVQFEERLELRDMSSGFFPQQGKVTLPQTSNGVLEFGPSGSLLAVGHSHGLRVYTVPDLKIVLDKPGSQTTAIAFSPDGCLLAWGDTGGTVHIINAPRP